MSIRDLEEWVSECSQTLLAHYKDFTETELKSDRVQKDFEAWKKDITTQLSKMLQSPMARTKPEGFVVEMDGDKTEGLEEATKALGMRAGAIPLETEMANRDDWKTWMSMRGDIEFDHLLSYNF